MAALEGGRAAISNVGYTGEIEGITSDCEYREADPIRVDMDVLFNLVDAAGEIVYDPATDAVKVEWPGVGAGAPFARDNALLQAATARALQWPHAPLDAAQARLAGVIADEIAASTPLPLALPQPRDRRLGRIAAALARAPHATPC